MTIRFFLRIVLAKANYLQTLLIVLKWKLVCWLKYHDSKILKIEEKTQIMGGVDFLARRKGEMTIGKNTRIHKNSKIVIDGGRLHIGQGCCFGEGTIFNCFDNLIIGDNVLTADRVSFICNKHQFSDISVPIIDQATSHGDIVIGNGTWLGINAVVLDNTHIGVNCVVGANAVVKGDFPDYCVIAGSPGRIVKRYNLNNKRWEKIQ